MIVEPKVREFICTTAHPTGCQKNVEHQISYIQSKHFPKGPKKALVIGASTGYGLASRITAAFGFRAATIGVMFEKPATEKRTATPGWYNTAAFENAAASEGLYAKSINGDAFSQEIKEKTIDLIRRDLGEVDLVVYSLAAPRRTAPDGVTYSSCLKTVHSAFTEKSLDLKNNTITPKTVEPATAEEIEGTVKVMGGEDWMEWIRALSQAGVLAKGAVTVAYSYIGPKITYPIYFDGTIGQAKRHLAKTASEISAAFSDVKAFISVNKALVTQASSAIPIVPLYLAILYKVMKDQGTHEGCIEQIARLFGDKLFQPEIPVDKDGLIRMDDWELDPAVQEKVMKIWGEISTENLMTLSDIGGYWDDFYHMFGFRFDGVDYAKDVAISVPVPSLS